MKNLQNLLQPKVKELDMNFFKNSIPEIINVNYDLWSLKITLSFREHPSPVYVIFKNVIGFRVLDEGNLLEFWNPKTRASSWVWKIENGGWFDLEKLREGFLSQHHLESNNEYLILGINDCVSIICTSEPILINIE